MKTYLCAVSPQLPENYQIGLQALTWGVEKRYRKRIAKVRKGDELVFLSRNSKSIHRIEGPVYKDETVLWPPKKGDIFPYRIKISKPLYRGEIPPNKFSSEISFMRDTDAWGGTIQGASGVFNDRLTEEDVNFIRSRLRKIPVAKQVTARAAEEPKIKNLFRLIGFDVLQSLKRILPELGLERFNGKDFPAEYDLGYGGNVILCKDTRTGAFVVVDFNRGEAPAETLIRVLHYMSWVRQTLAGSKDVRGIVLTETANQTLSTVVKEVPNVDLQLYRIGIELLGEQRASA